MHDVYRLHSTRFPQRTYGGSTADLRQRLRDHNQGCCDYMLEHAAKRLLWSISRA